MLVHLDPAQIHLTIGGEPVETTPEHPFFTLERGWVDAADLWRGAHVRQADGSFDTVWSVVVETEPQVMYNLTVAQANTFFVGAGRWLVHNAPVCGYGDATKLRRKMRDARIPTPANHQPHHIIPSELDAWHPFVERAREAGWDINEHYNGIMLPDEARFPGLSQQVGLPSHSTNHPQYTARVLRALDALEARAVVEGWNNSRAFTELLKAASGFDLYIRRIGGGVRLQ